MSQVRQVDPEERRRGGAVLKDVPARLPDRIYDARVDLGPEWTGVELTTSLGVVAWFYSQKEAIRWGRAYFKGWQWRLVKIEPGGSR